jgi:hypothetical protein
MPASRRWRTTVFQVRLREAASNLLVFGHWRFSLAALEELGDCFWHEGLPARHQCGTGRAPRPLFGSRSPGVSMDGGSPNIRGLSEKEAAARLKAEGPNALRIKASAREKLAA